MPETFEKVFVGRDGYYYAILKKGDGKKVIQYKLIDELPGDIKEQIYSFIAEAEAIKAIIEQEEGKLHAV